MLENLAHEYSISEKMVGGVSLQNSQLLLLLGEERRRSKASRAKYESVSWHGNTDLKMR